MAAFDDRHRLQKTVYLLQAFGIRRGYEFGWYLRGPYCSLVAMDGFDLRNVYDAIPDGGKAFTTSRANAAFEQFCAFLRGKSTADLEIAASMHHLKHSGTGGCDGDIKKEVEQKRPEFAMVRVEEIWDELSGAGLV